MKWLKPVMVICRVRMVLIRKLLSFVLDYSPIVQRKLYHKPDNSPGTATGEKKVGGPKGKNSESVTFQMKFFSKCFIMG